jgi:hypothetical protein
MAAATTDPDREPESPENFRPPQGYWVVRIEQNERNNDEAWVLGASQGLDPAGEVSPGGYWLLHTTNNGLDWDDPLYTGLAVRQPYEVTSTSALPMLKKGGGGADQDVVVQIEVRRRELDPESITFPPVALRYKNEASGLYLEAPLAELKRDSDGDGLADIIEARLVTDAHAADTDSDGLADGSDPFPTVPESKGAGTDASRDASERSTAELLTAVLAQLFEEDDTQPPAQVVGAGNDPFKNAIGRPAPMLPRTSAVFFRGDRKDFVGVRSSAGRRVIVLSDAELLRISRERGVLYPMEVNLILDEKGEQAYVRFSKGWRGGACDAKRVKGRWVITPLMEWMS